MELKNQKQQTQKDVRCIGCEKKNLAHGSSSSSSSTNLVFQNSSTSNSPMVFGLSVTTSINLPQSGEPSDRFEKAYQQFKIHLVIHVKYVTDCGFKII